MSMDLSSLDIPSKDSTNWWGSPEPSWAWAIPALSNFDHRRENLQFLSHFCGFSVVLSPVAPLYNLASWKHVKKICYEFALQILMWQWNIIVQIECKWKNLSKCKCSNTCFSSCWNQEMNNETFFLLYNGHDLISPPFYITLFTSNYMIL